MEIFVKHYQSIFVAQPLTPIRVVAITECEYVIPQNLSPGQREFCDSSLSLENLKASFSQMANDKAHRIDGFPCEFYKEFWDMVGPDLL